MEKQKNILLFFNLLSVLEHSKEDELIIKCNTLLEKIESLRISAEVDNIIFSLYVNKGFWTKRQNNKKDIIQRILVTFDVCSRKFPNIKFENIICKEGYINSSVMNGGMYILQPNVKSVHMKFLDYINHYNNNSNLKEIIIVQTINDLDVYLINEMGSYIPFTLLFVKDRFEQPSTSNVITQQGPLFTEISTTFDGIDGAIYTVDAYSKLSDARKGLKEEDYAYLDGTIALPDDLNCSEAKDVFDSFKLLAKKKTLC